MTSATGSDDARLPEWSGNPGVAQRCAVRSRGGLGASQSFGLRRQAGWLKVWRGGGCKFSATKRAHKRNAGGFDAECRRPSLITTTDTLAGIATACVQRPRLLWKNLPPAGRSKTSGPAPLVLLKSASLISIPLAADLNAARQASLERFQKFCGHQGGFGRTNCASASRTAAALCRFASPAFRRKKRQRAAAVQNFAESSSRLSGAATVFVMPP